MQTMTFLGNTFRIYQLDGRWAYRVSGRWPVQAGQSKEAAILAAKMFLASQTR